MEKPRKSWRVTSKTKGPCCANTIGVLRAALNSFKKPRYEGNVYLIMLLSISVDALM
jgi:hypothetical protein